jgi:hypothetical protein
MGRAKQSLPNHSERGKNISRTIHKELVHRRMSDDPLDRIPSFDRVSVRAVVVYDEEDPAQALSEAGIFDPIALPAVFGEDQSDFSIGDGITPNLVAVLETEQVEDDPFDTPSRDDRPQFPDNGSQRPTETSQAQPLTASLPAAYGIQPLAPVRPRAATRGSV